MTKGRTPPTATNGTVAVSPVDDWYKTSEEGELYRLPGSGHIARLRRPSLYALLTQASEVPNAFSADLTRLLAQPVAYDDQEKAQRIRQNARAFQEAAALCFVEPKLILDRHPERSHGEIGPGQLADQDYLWLFYAFIEGESSGVESFRIS